MSAKRLFALVVASLFAAQAHGQLAGLPVADVAASGDAGEMGISGGLVMGDDLNLYGGRFSFNALDELSLFGGAGIVDPDGGDAGFGIQGGALFSLPPIIPDLPIDLAARGTASYADVDQEGSGTDVSVDIITVTASGLASIALDDMFSLYGHLGLAYIRTKASAGGGSSTDDDTEPALGVGVIASLMPELDVYAEFMYIDDPWFGLGVRWNL